MTGLFWEEFRVGDRFITPGRTLGEADSVGFADFIGDYDPLVLDDAAARAAGLDGRVVHDLYVYAVVGGLRARLGIFDGTGMAFLESTWQFLAPARFGDTIHAEVEVVDRKPTRHPDRGVMTQRIRVLDQRGRLLQEGMHTGMYRRIGRGL